MSTTGQAKWTKQAHRIEPGPSLDYLGWKVHCTDGTTVPLQLGETDPVHPISTRKALESLHSDQRTLTIRRDLDNHICAEILRGAITWPEIIQANLQTTVLPRFSHWVCCLIKPLPPEFVLERLQYARNVSQYLQPDELRKILNELRQLADAPKPDPSPNLGAVTRAIAEELIKSGARTHRHTAKSKH